MEINSSTHKSTILLVDDDKRFCENAKSALQNKYKLKVVHTMTTAKKIISKESFDVLLLDLFIETTPPEENPDGYELIDVFRRKNRRSIIIAVTLDAKQMDNAYEKKVDSFFYKRKGGFLDLSYSIDNNLAKKRALTGNETVFFSYSSKDEIFVKLINRELKDRKFKTWLDKAQIKAGDSISKKVFEGINGAKYLLIFLSKNSINSSWVQAELDSAIWKEIDKKSLRIVPIICGSFDDEMPIRLEGKKHINFAPLNKSIKINYCELFLGNSKRIRDHKEIFEEKMKELLDALS